MDRKPYVYEPDECFDLGEGGEHPIQITALIDEDSRCGRTFRSVNIVCAIVTTDIPDADGKLATLNVTQKILSSPNSRERWEEEIYAAYKKPIEREWDEVGS